MSGITFARPALKLLTEEDPPFSFTGADGKPTGYGVEVVKEIQRRIGSKEGIEIYPWARAYYMIKKKPNIVVFTMSRTKERDPLFQWVGPIIENDWVFLGKKGSGVKIKSLKEAKQLKSIGVINGYAWDSYLTNQGFYNLTRVRTHSNTIKMLHANHVQAVAVSNLGYRENILHSGLDPNDFEILYKFNSVQMYIAHSKTTDKATVNQWQAAFVAMKADGTLAIILKKWIPLAELPEETKVLKF